MQVKLHWCKNMNTLFKPVCTNNFALAGQIYYHIFQNFIILWYCDFYWKTNKHLLNKQNLIIWKINHIENLDTEYFYKLKYFKS